MATSGKVETKFPPFRFEINSASSARLHKFILLSASLNVAMPILMVILFSVFLSILAVTFLRMASHTSFALANSVSGNTIANYTLSLHDALPI